MFDVFRSREYHAERAQENASRLLVQARRAALELDVAGRVLEKKRDALMRAGVGAADPRAQACRRELGALQRERQAVLSRTSALNDALFRVRMQSIDRGRAELSRSLVRACAIAESEVVRATEQAEELGESAALAEQLHQAMSPDATPVVDEAAEWDAEVDRRKAREVEQSVARSAATALRNKPVG